MTDVDPVSPARAARDRSAGLFVAGALAAALAHLAIFWPGIMVWDAIRQYGQALAGRYDDWHPPAMNWLWHQLLVFHDGPAPMLVLQVLLYWSGIALLARQAWNRASRLAPVALILVAALPIPLVLIGTVLKDSLMAGLLLLSIGLCRHGGRPARIAAAALLLGAATLRFNAAPACLPLVWLLLPDRWPRGQRIAAIAGALALLVAAMPVANRLLRAERSGVELSLVLYDLAGITRYGGVDVFPPLGLRDPIAINARCYDPVSWDRYAWWGDDPCPINFTPVRVAYVARGEGTYRRWLGAILTHPLAYARHRLGHFNHNARFLIHDAEDPVLSLRSDPNVWHFTVAPNALRAAIGAAALWSLHTPLGWPACWLALGLGVLILAPTLPNRRQVVPVAASALLYGFSYLPLSVASEVRYHLWTMLGIAIAAILAADGLRHVPNKGKRLAWAVVPVATVASLAVGARLL